MTRPRKNNPDIPAHIDQSRIPVGVYFNPKSRNGGMWYTLDQEDSGKKVRHFLAEADATLGMLYQALENFEKVDIENFDWLCRMYFQSDKFSMKAKTTQREYQIYFNKLFEIPTKRNGVTIPSIPLTVWDTPLVQKIVDHVAKHRGPTAAKHTHSFIRMVFGFGRTRVHGIDNPAVGVDLPVLKPNKKIPVGGSYEAIVEFAKRVDVVHYWKHILELEYLCRMRGIEVRWSNDADILEEGLLVRRAKGSRDTIIKWNPRLRAVVDDAIATRSDIWFKRRYPVPLHPERRPLIVNREGAPLSESAYRSSWERFITKAIREGVISKEERFSPHGLKHKGVTETPGTRAEKQEATGHRSAAMTDYYDNSISIVEATSE